MYIYLKITPKGSFQLSWIVEVVVFTFLRKTITAEKYHSDKAKMIIYGDRKEPINSNMRNSPECPQTLNVYI